MGIVRKIQKKFARKILSEIMIEACSFHRESLNINHTDVMIDIETTSKRADAGILEISAVAWDRRTGHIDTKNAFSMKITWSSNVIAKRHFDNSTIEFWAGVASKSSAAKSVIYDHESRADLNLVLAQLLEWLHQYDFKKVKCWGNGASFDLGILSDACDKAGYSMPPFWNFRDVRTQVDVGEEIDIFTKRTLKFTGTPHVSLDDCIHQIRYVQPVFFELYQLARLKKLLAEYL